MKPHNTSLVQQASSALCDEIVQIWRLIALNPRLNHEERDDIYRKLCLWHSSIIERICKQKSTNSNVSAAASVVYTSPTMHASNDRTLNQKRRDVDIFPGFLPAIEVCQIDWNKCEYFPKNIEQAFEISPWPEYIRCYDEILSDGYLKLFNNNLSTIHFNLPPTVTITSTAVTNETTNSNIDDIPIRNQTDDRNSVAERNEGLAGRNSTEESARSNTNEECRIYFSDAPTTADPSKQTTTMISMEPYTLRTLRIINDPLQVVDVEDMFRISSTRLICFSFRLLSSDVKHFEFMGIMKKFFNLHSIWHMKC